MWRKDSGFKYWCVSGTLDPATPDVGPAALWKTKLFDHNATFIAKWLHEYHAERRLKGDHIMLSLAASFWHEDSKSWPFH